MLKFFHKNKLKSEIFNDKKSLETKLFFSVIIKNSSWEILTKNLVTLKDKMGLRMKNFNILGVRRKIPVLEGELMKNQYGQGDCLRGGERGGGGGGAWQERGRGCF